MALTQRVKRAAISTTTKTLLQAAARASDRDLLRLVGLLKPLLPKIDFYQNGLETVGKLFEQKHEGLNAARRILTEPSRHVVSCLVDNMIVGSFMEGYKRRYAFWEKHGVGPPGSILISPTMRCNMDCEGCYAGEYSRGEDLDRATVDRLVGESLEMGTCSITFLGGEPFLWPDLLDVFEAHPKAAFQVYTNGTLLDEATIKRLAAAGNVLVCLGIEGWREATDRRRGEGSFDRVLELMDLMRRERMLIAYSVTATRHNVDEVTDPEFVRMMLDHGAHLGWYFHYQPTGRCPSADLLPTPEQRIAMRERLREARRTIPILIVDFLNDGFLTEGCMGAGRRYVHINHRGDVEPCIFVHFSTDNIHEKSLGDAICSDFFRSLRDQMPFHPNYLRPCMILDNPHFLRKAVRDHHACPTHPEAQTLFTDFAPTLDAYASEYAPLADAAWQQQGKSKK